MDTIRTLNFVKATCGGSCDAKILIPQAHEKLVARFIFAERAGEIFMDTEKTYRTYGPLKDITIVKLGANDLEDFKRHVEITRHLQEIHSLFLIFKFQIDILQKEYTLKSGGRVFINQRVADRQEDYIAINAHTINIISAGKTLVQSMESFVDMDYFPPDSELKKEYLDYYHNVYDHSFAYRLMIRLRDYAQHGHLPIDNNGNEYHINLVTILRKPHYNHNKTIADEMKKIADEVGDVYDDIPTFSLTLTLAEFTSKLLSIYQKFWNISENALLKSQKCAQDIIKRYPENIINTSEESSGFFIYDEEPEGWIHAVSCADDPGAMYTQFKNEAQETFDEYMNAWHELTKGTVKIQCINKERIEVEFVE